VPFVFVYGPAMLLVTKDFTWFAFWETTLGCIVGIVMLAASLTGYGRAPIVGAERMLLLAASIMVIMPSRTATLIGLALAAPVVVRQFMASRRVGNAPLSPHSCGHAPASYRSR
jgi:TRAP-type uncharacterized transport system fused permease subunit